MKRREFLKTSVAATALTAIGAAAAQPPGAGAREIYELRAYGLKAGANHQLLDEYLAKTAVSALNRAGVESVGVFTEPNPKEPSGPAVYLLIPYASLETFGAVTARFNEELGSQKEGVEYLQSPKSNPAFERIDSWLLLAFAGLPRLELPAYCRDRKPRLFELRTYESHSELKALKKVAMFNAGEIETMREVGLGPIFFGQALVGANLPHLTYMLSAETQEAHKKHWDAFRVHPVWTKLKDDPQYADTVSNIKSRMLEPTPYSQI